jgi:hypothetical protein
MVELVTARLAELVNAIPLLERKKATKLLVA